MSELLFFFCLTFLFLSLCLADGLAGLVLEGCSPGDEDGDSGLERERER